ncbi:MAG: zf-TFIIB domain-containing protein, partial [Bacteroidota bacterium]
MLCPKCSSELRKELYRGIEVDKCVQCQGMWLDLQELDQLEDEAFDVDRLKGTLLLTSVPTENKCPHCQSKLRQFEYRFTSLILEYCENQHGYWLDAGEAERVLQLMKEREKGELRIIKAEADWNRSFRVLRSKS